MNNISNYQLFYLLRNKIHSPYFDEHTSNRTNASLYEY